MIQKPPQCFAIVSLSDEQKIVAQSDLTMKKDQEQFMLNILSGEGDEWIRKASSTDYDIISREFYGKYAIAAILQLNSTKSMIKEAQSIVNLIMKESKSENILKIMNGTEQIEFKSEDDRLERYTECLLSRLSESTKEKLQSSKQVRAISWVIKYGDSPSSRVVGLHKLRSGESMTLKVAIQALEDFVLPESFMVGDKAFMVVMYIPTRDGPAYAVIVSPQYWGNMAVIGDIINIVKEGLKEGMNCASERLCKINRDGFSQWNIEQAIINLKHVNNQLMRLPKDLTFWDEVYLFLQALGTDVVTSPFKTSMSKAI